MVSSRWQNWGMLVVDDSRVCPSLLSTTSCCCYGCLRLLSLLALLSKQHCRHQQVQLLLGLQAQWHCQLAVYLYTLVSIRPVAIAISSKPKGRKMATRPMMARGSCGHDSSRQTSVLIVKHT